MATPNSIIQSTRNGVVSLISSKVIGKVFNFGANVLITRNIGRKVMGTGSIRFDDILFLGPLLLTRDGLRRAAYRSNNSDPDVQQSLSNLAWLVSPVTALVSLLLAYVMLKNEPEGVEDIDAYQRAIMYTVAAVVLSILTEPVFILAQCELLTSLRAKIEVYAVVGKCVTMLYLTIGCGMDIEAFAIANLIQALISFGSWWTLTTKRPRFQSLTSGWWVESTVRDTVVVFWYQSVQKWFLENGEKIILVFVGTPAEQGVYVIVERLGSIVVRLLFQPLEEMTLATLSKLTILKQNGKQSRVTEKMSGFFSESLTILTLIGTMFVCFGTAYSHLLIHVLYGSVWSSTSAPATLSWYCVYVLFMAVNGILEAFVQGTSTQKGLQHYNRWMVVFSIIYICAICILLPLFGNIGLIIANIVKMSCRIVVCTVVYIKPYFKGKSVGISVNRKVCCYFVVSFLILQSTQKWIYVPSLDEQITTVERTIRVLLHLVCGLVCCSATSWAIWTTYGRRMTTKLG